jgi:2-phospho-L-lactate guanylyltransferase
LNGPIALIPVNRLERAKGRLSSLLTAEERVDVAMATCSTVITAARRAGLYVAVLTSDPRIAALTGITVIDEDPALEGLNAQLESAILQINPPAAGLLILHADLPLATPGAILGFVSQAPTAPSATLVRSRDGGTTAMLLRPPGRFSLSYGPNSAELHVAAAEAAGMTVRTADAPALALDLDTPDDLDALMAVPGGAATPAGRIVAAALARVRRA